jgi:hypothetical protein
MLFVSVLIYRLNCARIHKLVSNILSLSDARVHIINMRNKTENANSPLPKQYYWYNYVLPIAPTTSNDEDLHLYKHKNTKKRE